MDAKKKYSDNSRMDKEMIKLINDGTLTCNVDFKYTKRKAILDIMKGLVLIICSLALIIYLFYLVWEFFI
jgi:hypothetical protein